LAGAVVLALVALAVVIWKMPERCLLRCRSSHSDVLPAIARGAAYGQAGTVRCCREDEARALRLNRAATWRFFTAFVGAETGWLPPDNFSGNPTPTVAQRTSPTNIGL